MPGYLGGGSSGGGVGGEIRFPTEFIDPVTKLRVSNPQNLIDTDFEYGLQPTKWETVELINNTPSFFSKSGDTTIDGIEAITTNAGTREIIVRTRFAHELAVGIPINVQGTKSITADGSYIINSIPNANTFTYLCKDNQPQTASIEDLYTSVITGEFFQGSQLRISDDQGIVTDGGGVSNLTITTDSTHGFKVRTPFYFLNLNSTIAQEFQATNTAAKSFDASNSATAQIFDGSNTLSSVNIDFSNSATSGGTVSNITAVNTVDDTITVSHTTENFSGRRLGTPLYYDVTAGSGFFLANPRGVVFLKTTGSLGSSSSVFQVSETPDGNPIDITGAMTGTFQLANQARTFAGNNVNEVTQANLEIIKEQEFGWDAANDGSGQGGWRIATVFGYNNSVIQVTTPVAETLDFYSGAMVQYTTTGTAATNLVNNATYFVTSAVLLGTVSGGTLNLYSLELRQLPGSTQPVITGISGGSGTQRLTRIGISLDKDIVHIRGSNFELKDMIYYDYPTGGNFGTQDSNDIKRYYFVDVKYDTHNYRLSSVASSPLTATGGAVTQQTIGGVVYNVHTFTAVAANTFTVSNAGSTGEIEVFAWGAGGGGGGNSSTGNRSGGAGAAAYARLAVTAGTYTASVGGGGGGAQDGCLSNIGAGAGGQSFNGASGGVGGLPGPCSSPGGGGGAGTLFLQGSTILVAAGGGGGGGGSESVQNGFGLGGGGGQAGTGTTSGFAGGNTGTMPGSNGGNGENAFPSDASAAGGGGGGFRGGAGGQWPRQDAISAGGGGGGSSYVIPTRIAQIISNGDRTTPGDASNPLRGTSGNAGGAVTSGQPGRIVIRYPAE